MEEQAAYDGWRSIAGEIVDPNDVANACFAFAGGLPCECTGNTLNADGGAAAGFVP